MTTQTALVTGANSGIGRATALALKNEGFDVFAGARRPADLIALGELGLRPVQLDVTQESDIVAAVAQIEAAGGIDVLVNSAGYGVMGPMEEMTMTSLREQFEVNVFGLLESQPGSPARYEGRRKGRIIHIGSVGGLFTAPGAGAYHMSKYAVEALTDAMRAEVRGFGIEVAVIEPAGVRTPFIGRQIATMAPDGPDAAYGAFKTAFAKGAVALFDPGSNAVVTAEDVAESVVHAATARRPRTRYRVGAVANIIPVVRRMTSDRMWDRLMLMQVGVTPGREKRRQRGMRYTPPSLAT